MPDLRVAAKVTGLVLATFAGLTASQLAEVSTATPEVVQTAAAETQTVSFPPAVEPTPNRESFSSEAPAPVLEIEPTATMSWAPVLEPANFVDIYQLIDPAHGFLASGGTRYLVAHSYAKGSGAPGNSWEALMVGDAVSSGGRVYVVTRIATPAKGHLADEPVWTNDPDRLVLITCVSRGPGNPATNNMVITLEATS